MPPITKCKGSKNLWGKLSTKSAADKTKQQHVFCMLLHPRGTFWQEKIEQ